MCCGGWKVLAGGRVYDTYIYTSLLLDECRAKACTNIKHGQRVVTRDL